MESTAQLDQFGSALIGRLAAFQQNAVLRDLDEDEFKHLALKLFGLQFEANRAYRSFCQSRGVHPEALQRWQEIPVVPTVGFKEFELSCLAPNSRTAVFHSSGTSEQRPSRHYHNRTSLRVYEASVLACFRAHFLPELGRTCKPSLPELKNLSFVFLTPPLSEAPHSSLVHMFETVGRAWGSESMFLGQVTADGGWRLEPDQVVSSLRQISATARPVALLGTAFSFVHLLDYMAEQGIRAKLPLGSRVLETGGYKGRSRAVPKAELRSLILEWLGIGSSHLLSEYGMSELSSQAYDGLVGRSDVHGRVFCFPPWARARVVSPENGCEVREGESGLLSIIDVANVYSTMGVQTEDLAIRRGSGFELIGRAIAAEPRGCSLMATS